MTDAVSIATFGDSTASAVSLATLGRSSLASAPSPPSPGPAAQASFGGGGGGFLPYFPYLADQDYPVERYFNERGVEVLDLRGPEERAEAARLPAQQNLVYVGGREEFVPAAELNLTMLSRLEAELKDERALVRQLTLQLERSRIQDAAMRDLTRRLSRPTVTQRPQKPEVRTREMAPPLRQGPTIFSRFVERRLSILQRRRALVASGVLFPRLRMLLRR